MENTMLELMNKRKKRALSVMLNKDAPLTAQARAYKKVLGLTRSLQTSNVQGASYEQTA